VPDGSDRGGRLRPAPTALALLLLATGCTRGHAAAAPTPGPCASRRPAIGPDVTTSLRTEDRGATLCLRPGEVVSVYLSAPLDTAAWSRIDSSKGSVLARRANNAVTLARGVTAAVFVARKPGVVELAAVRAPCASAHGGCDAGHSWTAVVVVAP
jgi:hypothetical protein